MKGHWFLFHLINLNIERDLYLMNYISYFFNGVSFFYRSFQVQTRSFILGLANRRIGQSQFEASCSGSQNESLLGPAGSD